MNFFPTIKSFSHTRFAWCLLFIIVILFQAMGLYFQHQLDLPPCVMCIYQRVALVGIGLAALLGMLAPQKPIIFWPAMCVWGYSGVKGLLLTLEHIDYQFNPSPFATCDLFVTFPDWAPLNLWAPWLFEAYGDCSQVIWQFLTLSMPEWLAIIFTASLIALGIVALAQCSNKSEPQS